ncbi:MAG TPA: hypothetical protein VGC42_13900, partial [Kofleriaceae bacterium]
MQNNTQGSTELWVKVPPEANLRWRAVPLQLTDSDNQAYHVMITQVTLWGANTGTSQLDAYQYLQQWFVDAGTGYGVTYSSASQPLNLTDPSPGSASLSNQAQVQKATITDPFVQATCTGAMANA